MSKRLDCMYPLEYQDRDGKTQTSWYRCGTAFQDDSGRITVRVAMLPVGHTGELKIMLMEPKSNGPGQQQERQQGRTQQPAGAGYTGGGEGGGSGNW